MALQLHLQLTSCNSLIIFLFIVLMTAERATARKITDTHQKMSKNHVHDLSSSSMEHLDPSLHVFFTINDLKLGKTMPIFFPYTSPSATPKFLPREEADSIPFSTSQLHHLLTLFSFVTDSPQAKAVEYTLEQCELESIRGETKFCATSLESMLDFAINMLGSAQTQLKILTTTRLSNSTVVLQNYTVVEAPKETVAAKMVACHSMPYPYAVFYCHCQESRNRLFEVLLRAENGDGVKASAICHMDTSAWDEDHASFRVLKSRPGASHVCHFLSTDSVVWLPNTVF